MRRLLHMALLLWCWESFAAPQGALSSGELFGVDDLGCSGGLPQRATFTSASSTYAFTGSCLLTATRSNSDATFPWTGAGAYDPSPGGATEKLTVPAPKISEPSRPYGTFQAVMHCGADPRPNADVRCDHIVAWADAPLDHTVPNAMRWTQPYPLAPVVTGLVQQNGRPFTSFMNQDTRNKLATQDTAALAAQRKGPEVLQTAPQQSVIGQVIFPSVLLPTKGQNFFSQTPVPIKLAPPNGWSVTGYLVDIESNGRPLCNIPVGAADAQSPLGYREWGAGNPPCFLAIPGTYRLRAQVISPRQSGWSDWVQFTVSQPRFTTPIRPRGIEGEQSPEPPPGTPGPSEQPSGKQSE